MKMGQPLAEDLIVTLVVILMFISGGCNEIQGPYSSIMGGCNNFIPSSLQYAAVFGQSVTAVCNNMLHTENLYLKPTSYCSYPGFAPLGHFQSGVVYIDTSIGAGLPLRIAP